LLDTIAAPMLERHGVDSCLRNWLHQADVEDGRRPGLTRDEREELVELRREFRVAKMENEILKRAAAFFVISPSTPLCGRVDARTESADESVEHYVCFGSGCARLG